MKIVRSLLILIAVTLPMILWADERSEPESNAYHYYVKRTGTEQGLTNPAITAIHTCSDGTVWIGTRYLLNKYVNGELISYDEEQTRGSYITMLYEDSNDQMWIGTDRSLMKYESDTDSFIEFYSDRVSCTVEYKGVYYFAGKRDIIKYNPSDKKVSLIPTTTSHIIKAFVFAEDVLLFVDKYNGLYYYNVGTASIARMPLPEIDKSTILSACVDDSCLYLGVFFKGIYKIDQSGKIIQRYLVEDYPHLRLEVICDIARVGGNILLGTDGSGVCTIKGDAIETLTDIPEYSGLTDLPSAVTVVTEDKYSNIWIGSVRNGIVGIKPTRITDTDDYISLNKPDGGSFAVLSMARTDDILWIGTEGGLFRYDTKTKNFRLEPDFSNDMITSVIPLSEDVILLSSYCKGLFTLNTGNGQKSRFILENEETNRKEILSGYNINFSPLSDCEVIILGGNVYRYNWKTGHTLGVSPDYGVSPSGLHLFYVSPYKSEAFAYSTDAFYRIDLVRNRISQLSEPYESTSINTAVYSEGKIYFGTDNGLYSYCVQSREYDTIRKGLFKRVTHTSLRNGKSIWVTSNNILYSLETDNNIVEVYDEAEGFSSKEVVASERVGDYFYFGGINNISEVPSSITSSIHNTPSISLLGVYVDNAPREIHKNGKIRIPYRHNKIDIQYVLKGEDPFRRTMMKYSISGPESYCVETPDYTCSLPRLYNGRHSVYASFLQSDGQWSTPVNYVQMIVCEPFWRRLWFLFSIAALFAAMSIIIINRNAHKAQRQLQSAIQRNRDMEQEKRHRFINSIESEMAKPIARIKKLSGSILEKGGETSIDFRKSIEKIYSSSTHLEKMMDLAIKQERPAEEENPLLGKLNQIIDARISDQNLDVSVLVKEMAMSRTILYDKVKSLSGLGINEYIQNRRLMLARKLLVETDLSMAEIATEIGVSSSKYFSEIFKKMYDTSPREFRKRIMDKTQS
ncbi:MAG: helix-turn-helix transcriptional regulator [Bacteroidales bacterium]|nr:helix-turn-helix transcriptional regulator [Bacteroidales bacterium]